jgi:hypothetical protein
LLSSNPAAIELLSDPCNQWQLDWDRLSTNSAAIALLMANSDKINWFMLSKNPSAIEILKANSDKINWFMLSTNPAAIDLLIANPDKIKWAWLLRNPKIHEIVAHFMKLEMMHSVNTYPKMKPKTHPKTHSNAFTEWFAHTTSKLGNSMQHLTRKSKKRWSAKVLA